jgi:hypothetical protein
VLAVIVTMKQRLAREINSLMSNFSTDTSAARGHQAWGSPPVARCYARSYGTLARNSRSGIFSADSKRQELAYLGRP